MNARDAILGRLRRVRIDAPELPPTDGPWTSPADRRAAFVAQVAAVGGEVVEVAPAELPARIAQTAAAREVRVAWSAVEEWPRRDRALVDPHDAEEIELAVVRGAFGVAENGAIWIPEAGLEPRSVLFLTQHLGVVLAADDLVDHMHAAYARLAARGDVERGFGAFVSGPSKTADIEQALVLGAHGACTLTVFLVKEV